MSQNEFDHLLQKYLSGNCPPEEARKVRAWSEQLEGNSRLALTEEQQQTIEGKIWTGILADIGQSVPPAVKGRVAAMRPVRLLRVAVAACLVLLTGIGLYFYLLRDPNRSGLGVPPGYLGYINKERAAKIIRLADGSSVTLQPQAALYYPEDFSEKTRDVYLRGDAFFSVHRNPARHFIVHAGEGLLTEVLGTSFHVRQQAKAGRIEVSVVTGKVWVRRDNKTGPSGKASAGVVLTPNQKAVYTAARTELVASLADQPGLLLPEAGNEFVFEDAPLIKVLETLQQAYGIDITAENNLENCHFTGDLGRTGLYEKLELLCLSTGASYQLKGTTIVVTGAGCP